jgi:hypothetical protein
VILERLFDDLGQALGRFAEELGCILDDRLLVIGAASSSAAATKVIAKGISKPDAAMNGQIQGLRRDAFEWTSCRPP